MNVSRVLKTTALMVLTATLSAGGLTACTDNAVNSVSANINIDESDPLFQQRNIGNFELTGTKKIVLTFDDGPSGEATPVLLDILSIFNIKATFFVLGKQAKKYPEIMKRMRDEGHTIGNHSYSHDALNKKLYSDDIQALLHEVVNSDKEIRPYMVPSKPRYFRAPYGAWTATHAAKLNSIASVQDYIGPIFWNVGGALSPNITVDPLTGTPSGKRPTSVDDIQTGADWDCWTGSKKLNYPALSVEICLAGYLKDIRRKQGGVVLMHDLTLNTVEMVSRLIPTLLREGYTFVNLEDIRTLEQYQ